MKSEKTLSTFWGGVSLAMMISTHLIAASVTPIPAPEFIPMEADINLGGNNKVLVQKTFTLQAGEMRRVLGRVVIASTVDSTLFASAYTQCVTTDGTVVSELGDTNQNHQGKNTPIGPSYPWPGELALYPSLLFQAAATGTYTCQLWGDGAGNSALTAVARDNEGFSNTWLQVSAANDAGASWWQNLPCDMYGTYNPPTSSCLYLGGASGLQQLYVFDNDGSPAKVWEAASDAAFVDASDSILLTTCYYGTNSCTSKNSESWWTHLVGDPNGTVVDSHLELIQLNAAQGVCMVTQSPEQRSSIGNAPHHYMIYHSLLTVPVYPQCGSRLFKLRISVKYVSGDPVKIDGSGNSPGMSTFTHAFAINSVYGSVSPVPNLFGLTESAARNDITASGYAVSSVSSSLSAAPADTVIAQYPAAGTIQLPGTGVDFTVSTGGAAVPNLLGLPQSSATGAITALGLVPSVSFSKACINPGDVLTQSPPAGTLVARGSAVRITVDSGTRQTCVVK